MSMSGSAERARQVRGVVASTEDRTAIGESPSLRMAVSGRPARTPSNRATRLWPRSVAFDGEGIGHGYHRGATRLGVGAGPRARSWWRPRSDEPGPVVVPGPS